MPFKTHLAIVTAILLVVYFVWQTLGSRVPQEKPLIRTEAVSPYSISIANANWSRNCLQNLPSYSLKSDGFAKLSEGTLEREKTNDLVSKLSELCNGKNRCELLTESLSSPNDPTANCAKSELEVEYRCFSYDRPWRVSSESGKLAINCDKS